MALQGTLDEFGLADILRLLAATGKTGQLRLEGDEGRGVVWVRDGMVTAMTADRSSDTASPEETLFLLLRLPSGWFTFQVDDRSPEADHPHEVHAILGEAEGMLREWHELRGVVPSLDHRLRLVTDLPIDTVTIGAEQWPLLVAAAPGCRVGELADARHLGELDALRAVRDLLELGVVEVEPPGGRRPGPGERRDREGAAAGDPSELSRSGPAPPDPPVLGGGPSLQAARPGPQAIPEGDVFPGPARRLAT